VAGGRRRRALVEYIVEHSLLLAIGSVIALVWANTPDAERYYRVAAWLHFPVNELGMVFFFALAAKEIVEATSPGGALHTWRRAALPAVAAVGGMAAPALIYVLYVYWETQLVLVAGWAVPCATDIAFSYLVVKLIYKTAHHPAIPFLLLLAIADDALGLVILAIFYPVGQLHLLAGSVLMAAALAVSFGLRRARVKNFWPYVTAGGVLSWAALHYGGLHPALALVPVIPFLPHAARDKGLFVEAPPGARDALSQFERTFKYPVQIVLLLFGFANSGVRLGAVGAGTWAVLVAIVVGKPLGIALSVAISVAAGLRRPENLRSNDVLVVGFAAGIGFTVALFFAVAAYPPGPILEQLKLGALLSVGSGVLALVAAVLFRVGRFRVSRASPGSQAERAARP
jgi:NhaA family Na+:H+ antiporter